MSRRVYLDNAATSWPKMPEAVEAACDFINLCGATTGRGGYSSARKADQWLSDARVQLARLLDAPRSQSIAMCASGTHALNAALSGVLSPGDHILTTGIEHNSVLRPLENLRKHGIEYDVVPVSSDTRARTEAAESLVRKNTRMIALGHASNVTGAVNDLQSWSAFAKQKGLRILVDASQTIGYLPISIRENGIDILAAAGHKGLGGLAGTGILYVDLELQSQLMPLQYGGTGQSSEQLDAPNEWPLSVEVGNLNMSGVVSMAVAAKTLADTESLTSQWLPTFTHLVDGLRSIANVRLVGPLADGDLSHISDSNDLVPVASVQVPGWDVHDLATILDEQFQVEVRAGLHCAALVHRYLSERDSLRTNDDSSQSGPPAGTLRFSTGRYTTEQDVDIAVEALREIVGS